MKKYRTLKYSKHCLIKRIIKALNIVIIQNRKVPKIDAYLCCIYGVWNERTINKNIENGFLLSRP